MTATEFDFDRSFDVTAGETIVVEMRNRGSIEHNWTLLAQGVTTGTGDDVRPEDILAQTEADASQSDSVEFVAPPAGSYRVVCTIPGHLEAGMETVLITG